MPLFSKAKVEMSAVEDISKEIEFLEAITIGNIVSIPLGKDEGTRDTMRRLNRAAKHVGKRLSRIPTDSTAVKFKVQPIERRAVNLSAEQRLERVAKAKETRRRHATTTA
jgi:hypothetical protein